MRRGVTTRHLLLVVMLAVSGVTAAHALEYFVLAPHAEDRHELLAHTGHGYLPLLQPLAVSLAVLAFALLAMTAFGRAVQRAGGEPPSVAWARVLPIAQAVAFACLEVGERLTARASLRDLGVVLLVGIPIQMVTGRVAARFFVAIERAATRLAGFVARRASGPARRTSVVWVAVAAWQASSAAVPGPLPARGPPLAPVRT